MRSFGYLAFAAAIAVAILVFCGNPFGTGAFDLELQVTAREGNYPVSDFELLVNGVPVDTEHQPGSDYRTHVRRDLAPEGVLDVAVRRGAVTSPTVQVPLDPGSLTRGDGAYVWRRAFRFETAGSSIAVVDGDGRPLSGVVVATASDTLGTTDATGRLTVRVDGPTNVFPHLPGGITFQPAEALMGPDTPAVAFQVHRLAIEVEAPIAGRVIADGETVGTVESGGGLVVMPAGPRLVVFDPARADCRPDSQSVVLVARDRSALSFDPACGAVAAASTPPTRSTVDRPTSRPATPPRSTTDSGTTVIDRPTSSTPPPSRAVTEPPVRRPEPNITPTPPPRRDPVTPPPVREPDPVVTGTSTDRTPTPAVVLPEPEPESRPPSAPPVRLQFVADRAGRLIVNDEPVAELRAGTPFAKSYPSGTRIRAKLTDIDGDCAHAPIAATVDQPRQIRFTDFNCSPCVGGQSFGDDYAAALAFVEDHPACAHLAELTPPQSAYGQEEYREVLAYQGRALAELGRWADAAMAFRESLSFGADARVGADLAICQTNRRRYSDASEALDIAERSAQLNGAPSEVWEVIRAYQVFVLHGQYKASPPPTEEGRELYRNQICRAIATYEGRHEDGTNEALVRNVKALVCG